MKLFILRPDYPNIKEGDNPWNPEWDKTFGYVIRAENEAKARKMANRLSKYEFDKKDYKGYEHPFLYEKYTTCEELLPEGKAELIINDFRAG